MHASIRLFLSALALGFAGPATPQEPVDADPALWVARDADTTIYLFGTVHVLPPRLGWFDEGVKAAFDASDTLVLEIDAPPPEAMQAITRELGTSAASEPALSARLPEDRRAKLAAAFTELGWPAGSWERYEPWLAATTLSVLPLRRLGYDAANGPEKLLRDAARAQGKQVTGFEQARQQFALFDTLSEPAQIALLTRTLDGLGEINLTIERTVSAWSAGDAERMAAIVNEDLKSAPELRRTLLAERNAKWAEWIAARMAQPGTVFVAVGAGHLAGDASLQDELARRGIKVERVRY